MAIGNLTTAQGQVTVYNNYNTYIQKTTTDTLSDLREDESVTVMGIRDADGSIAAASIISELRGQYALPPP